MTRYSLLGCVCLRNFECAHLSCFSCKFITFDIQNVKFLQDMLISLKLLIIRRAKMIGCKELANKFDLKMLRVIGMLQCFCKVSDAYCSMIMPAKSYAFKSFILLICLLLFWFYFIIWFWSWMCEAQFNIKQRTEGVSLVLGIRFLSFNLCYLGSVDWTFCMCNKN